MARVHILGPSGSGVSTLGRSLAEVLSIPVFDIDDYFWELTEPRFIRPNPVDERHRLLQQDLGPAWKEKSWILAGSMDSWCDPYVEYLDLVVYLYSSPTIRIRRLQAREETRHGPRIAVGGDLNVRHEKFLTWAAQYDEGRLPGRNKARHERWLENLRCSVLRIEGDISPEESLARVLRALDPKASRKP